MIKCQQFYEQYKFHAQMNMKKFYNLAVCLFDLILSIPVINFSVISGRVFLGWTSTKQG